MYFLFIQFPENTFRHKKPIIDASKGHTYINIVNAVNYTSAVNTMAMRYGVPLSDFRRGNSTLASLGYAGIGYTITIGHGLYQFTSCESWDSNVNWMGCVSGIDLIVSNSNAKDPAFLSVIGSKAGNFVARHEIGGTNSWDVFFDIKTAFEIEEPGETL